ncbi:MAG: hypothetical protein EOO77_34155 [Oxalobacteraceae bacterium]|nr:MAG: hypothetical protein EOO77_34155 [Oxalobacteraceae bacterium]
MNKRTALALAAGMSLVCAGQAPASPKPCRDRSGKIINCPKVRKASPRCKDERGKFAPCTSKNVASAPTQ